MTFELPEGIPNAPDDLDAATVLRYVRFCANGWDPLARLLGNARAQDIIRAIDEVLVDAAFVEGIRACIDEVKRDANPHEFGGDQVHDRHTMWDNGWEWQQQRFDAGDILRDVPSNFRLRDEAMALYAKLVPMTDEKMRRPVRSSRWPGADD